MKVDRGRGRPVHRILWIPPVRCPGQCTQFSPLASSPPWHGGRGQGHPNLCPAVREVEEGHLLLPCLQLEIIILPRHAVFSWCVLPPFSRENQYKLQGCIFTAMHPKFPRGLFPCVLPARLQDPGVPSTVVDGGQTPGACTLLTGELTTPPHEGWVMTPQRCPPWQVWVLWVDKART